MISSLVTRTSAAALLLGGLSLLFGSDLMLPGLVPGFPPAATWLGQLLGAAWLGLAALNWLHRGAVLGGIYGRPVVLANLVTYLIAGLSLLKPLQGPSSSGLLWFLAVPATVLAIAYGALLFRGPFDLPRDGQPRASSGA